MFSNAPRNVSFQGAYHFHHYYTTRKPDMEGSNIIPFDQSEQAPDPQLIL